MTGPHIVTEEIVEGIDLFDEEFQTERVMVEDPISEWLGARAYVESHVDDDCVERFADGTWLEPQTFDRFYFERGLLLDIIDGSDPAEEKRICEEKHVAFKTGWALANDRRYHALLLRVWQDDPVGYFDRELTSLGLERRTLAQPVARSSSPEPGPSDPSSVHLGHEGQTPEAPVGATRGDDNPLVGVDLAAEGFEITEQSLAVEDEHGVTRPAEPAPETAVEAAPKPARKGRVQRPRNDV